MKKSRVLSFLLLFVFLSFLICQYPGSNAQVITLEDSKAVTSFSEAVEGFLLKDDIKKHPFLLAAVVETIILIFLISCIFTALLMDCRKLNFLTPIFYQANYTLHTP